MSKPETLKELMIAGDLTMGEARRLTRKVFNGNEVLVQDLIPYTITVPNLDDLPDHVTSFVIKAMLEASIVNVMEPKLPDDIVDAVNDPDEDREFNDFIGLAPKDGEFNG